MAAREMALFGGIGVSVDRGVVSPIPSYENQEAFKDPLHVPVGLITKVRSKKILFSGYRLGRRGGSFGRNLMCSGRWSRCCECHIGLIKKALHGYTHRGGDLLGSRAIYRERFGLLLKKYI